MGCLESLKDALSPSLRCARMWLYCACAEFITLLRMYRSSLIRLSYMHLEVGGFVIAAIEQLHALSSGLESDIVNTMVPAPRLFNLQLQLLMIDHDLLLLRLLYGHNYFIIVYYTNVVHSTNGLRFARDCRTE